MNRVFVWRCGLFWVLAWTAGSLAWADDGFAPASRGGDYRPQGPTSCFRQFNVDWSWINRDPGQVTEFLTQADPKALADWCEQTHVDGTVVMAVPHHGYCTYETRVGQKFPGMRGEWFGATVDELHKRRIAAFGYVTLNWNWKYVREHAGQDYVQIQKRPEGTAGTICLNAPGYLELVEAYTREIVERYPLDGMRWDILKTLEGCRCTGCRDLYQQRYGEELTGWAHVAPGRPQDFHMFTLQRAVERLRDTCRRIKPSLEVWQNHIQANSPIDLNVGRTLDIAYNEYGDPFHLLFIRGVTGKSAVINGLMNRAQADPPIPLDRPQWRLCLALGGRCYSYYGHKQTDHRTLLPGPTMLAWYRQQLAPFYRMVAQIEPWLREAVPVCPVGIVYGEGTRYRFPNYDRKAYVEPLEVLTNACLARNLPLEFVNVLDLGDAQRLIARFKLLVLPMTSGLDREQLEHLRRYVRQGGKLLVAGDALRHDQRGMAQADFSLAEEMGLSYRGFAEASDRSSRRSDQPKQRGVAQDLPVEGRISGCDPFQPAPVRSLVQVQARAGETLLSVNWQGDSWPLVHAHHCGEGSVTYLATLDVPQWTRSAIEWLAGPPPVVVSNDQQQAILTHQPSRRRWILHLIHGGDYSVTVRSDLAPVTRVAEAFPANGWAWRCRRADAGLQIDVTGPAEDRVLVLEP